jgi:hypothetical protein
MVVKCAVMLFERLSASVQVFGSSDPPDDVCFGGLNGNCFSDLAS